MNCNNIVVWVSQHCFIDHDIDIVPQVAEHVAVHWIILLPKQGARYENVDFNLLPKKHPNLRITLLYFKKRMRYPQNLFVYSKILNIINQDNPKCINVDIDFTNPWALPTMMLLPYKKTVLTVHQGEVHAGMKHHYYYNFIRKCVFARTKFVKMFSKQQADIFEKKYPNIKIFRNTLPLIKYGKPTKKRSIEKPVRFLSFGTINYAKNIELLIDAAESLYEEGEKDFVVSINGGCADWQTYKNHIKHPELFETDIRLIPNEIIPNLFVSAHFFVQPYRVVSQSGPLKIAYAYNTPVIVSNLPGFRDEVPDGVSGFIFQTENKDSLKETMKKAIECFKANYSEMLKGMKEYVDSNYSDEKLVNNYMQMFELITKQ